MTELSTALARAFERHLEIGGYRGNRGNQTVKTAESGVSNEEVSEIRQYFEEHHGESVCYC